MGLAASQARFLAITSRKADCEFRSMEIAQDKLSITRALTQATDDYQNAMNATKLIWDGETEDGTIYDLSYDIMMKPSELNGYSPYILTNRTGQVVVDEQLAKACEAAGISEIAGTGNLAGRNEFVRALADVGYISATVAEVITGDGGNPTVEWSDKAGFGGPLLDKSTATSMTIGTMVNFMENVLDPDFREQFAVGTIQRDNYDTLATALTIANPNAASTDDKSSLYISGTKTTDASFSIADLLTKDVTLRMNLSNTDLKQALQTIISTKNTDPTTYTGSGEAGKLLQILGGIATGFKALLVDDTQTQDTQAFEFALIQTLQQISNNTTGDGNRDMTKLLAQANAQNGGVYNGRRGTVLSLSNMAEMFLTNYAIALDGYNSGYFIAQKSADSAYVTNDYNYPYIIRNQQSFYEEKDLMVADFINVLYNNICTYGWTRSTGDVSDNEFLQNSLKNGKYFISSLNSDLYYYQDHYTKNGCVGEVKDEEAIAIAEAEYTRIKNQLNYKEETLEIEMKNLDLEISALTTEFDTVKSLISKNVEKVFTMFNS